MNACCGDGPYGGIFSCGGTKKTTEYSLCDNAEEHVWWDSFHPTEKIHQQFAEALWNGTRSTVAPYNLQHLFTNTVKRTIADVVDHDDPQQFINYWNFPHPSHYYILDEHTSCVICPYYAILMLKLHALICLLCYIYLYPPLVTCMIVGSQ